MLRNALLFCVAIVVASSIDARAQTNFSFFLGATSLSTDANPSAVLGASVGLTTKFNIVEILRIRSQIYVDRVQVEAEAGGMQRDESVTMVCLGFGAEAAFGGRDVDVFVNATPHGTIRTSFRTTERSDGTVEVANLTRFSLGIVFGAGFEVFITDNIGFELQGQYDIFNFDHSETDPVHRGVRGLAGVQFYLGRNFARD
jgi:hypothetical protein